MGEKNVLPKRQAGNITMRFATSSLVKAQLAASFDYNALKIAVTGQPRTDVLFESQNHLGQLLGEELDGYNKVVFYMPTYRHGYRDKEEGTRFETDNVFRMNEYDHQRFLNFLRDEKILFLLKLHPYEEKLYQEIDLGGNIRWITNMQMLNHDINTYDLLSQVDILMTDYSSIYFDFILLDRKMVFLPLDLALYENSRGFELEPYGFWTPGMKVFDQEAMQAALMSEDTDEERTARKTIRDIMFTYQDGQSSQRVFDAIKSDLRI
jgi:CDP-glycerol glycerophosphotransferase (TagB/SpsB family)